MSVHYLDSLFNPNSIAVFGASDKKNAIGMVVFKNLLEYGYRGVVYAINPKYRIVQNQPCYASIDKIGKPIDLALIATPASSIINIIAQCGENAVRSIIIYSAGFGETGKVGSQLENEIIALSKKYSIRILGPNCLGILLPHLNINATFSKIIALPGKLGLVSQSGGICAGILDWALDQKIGFSVMVSLGNATDLDFGDILDYLAQDNKTQSILLYIESLRKVDNFVKKLRLTAKQKPVFVIKAGRYQQGARAALTHTGALIGEDDVFDSVLKSAGAIRVKTIEQFFSAAEILSKNYPAQAQGLAIITNGGGTAVMAADYAQEKQISLPKLSDTTIKTLSSFLPEFWSHGNPIDLLGDASPERFQKVVKACIQDENIEAVLVILVPVVMTDPSEVAKEMISLANATTKPILACWLGENQVKEAWQLFSRSGVASFKTPEAALEAYAYLNRYYQYQKLLWQDSEQVVVRKKIDISIAKKIIENALAENRKLLSLKESKEILTAFGIPVTPSIEADLPERAVQHAESIGFPVVMKINSPDISHKQEAAGVQLNIINAEGVRIAFKQMVEKAKQFNPKAKILGVTIEKMQKEANDRELMIGIFTDALFGPVISFGAGGSIVDIMQDKAIALPPLTQFAARHMISKTRIRKLLGPFRNMPSVNFLDIEEVLLSVSEMACQLPEVREMDINPLIVNDKLIVAVDARIVIDYPK